MANEFYDGGVVPATGSSLSSATMRAEFAAVEAGFDKLPTLTGQANKLVKVNAGATALDTTDAPDINGGTIDGAVIGGTTPAAGTFTSLTANGNVSLGDATTDTVAVTGRFVSDLLPSTDNVRSLGSASNAWKDLHVDGTATIATVSATTASATNLTTSTKAAGTNDTSVATTAFVQDAVGGVLSKSVAAGGTIALTEAEAANPVLKFTGAIGSNVTVVVPVTIKRIWAVYNNTSNAYTLQVKTATGTGVYVAQGKRNLVYTDGTNCYDGFNDFESIAITGNPTISSNSTAAALTITQTGAGHALVVEDSANPDASPFVVSAAGDVGVGVGAPTAKLDVDGSLKVSGSAILGSASTNTHTINGSITIADNDAGTTSSLTQTRVVSDATTATWQAITTASETASATHYTTGLTSTLKYNVATGVTNSGYARAGLSQVFRNSNAAGTDDSGTLSGIYGHNITFGHFNTNTGATPQTTAAYGINISPYAMTGKIGTLYGINVLQPVLGGTLSDVAYACRLQFDTTAATSAYNIFADGTAPNYFAGNVGIGTSSPASALDVVGTVTATGFNIGEFATSTNVLQSNTGGTGARLRASVSSAPFPTFSFSDDDNTGIFHPATDTLGFGTAGTERLRIGADGGVGIGTTVTTASSHKLGVNGDDTNPVLALYEGTSGNTARLRVYVNDTNGITFNAVNTANAAKPIIFTRGASTESMRIDAAGNVGLGVTPSAWSSIRKAIQFGAGGVLAGSTVGYAFAEVGANAYTDASGNDIYIGTNFATKYRQNSGVHSWYTAPSGTAGNPITFTQAMTLDANGNVLIGKTTATANGGDLQLSTGITFPATQSAASDPNTLDDYEEGAFTPTIVGTTTAGAGTYTTQVGRYTKIGNLVYVTARLNWSAHTGTGNMQLSGLPFTVENVSSLYATANVYHNNLTSPASTVVQAIAVFGAAHVSFYSVPVAGGAAALLALDTAADVNLTLCYRVA